MKSVLCIAIFAALLTACSTVPYIPQQPIEPPIVPPPIDRPDLTLPEPDKQVGVPEHSDILPELTATLRTCRRDDECVKVKADCCGCSAGGQAATMTQEHVKYWENALNDKCKKIMCPAIISNHWTCQAEPTCFQNKCTLATP